MQDAQKLLVHIQAEDAHPAELEERTYQLRDELLRTEAHSVELVPAGPAPPGARAGEVMSLGSLLVTLAASGGVLTTIINVVQEWLLRQKNCSVEIETEGQKVKVTGYSPEETQRLVKEILGAQHPSRKKA